jgi:hypothetical protein
MDHETEDPMKRSDLSLTEHGAAFFPKALQPDETDYLRDQCSRVIGAKPGARIHAADGLGSYLTSDGKIGKLASGLLGDQARPVRAIMFDKPAATNWALGWHQDRTISVRDRREVEGFGPWTVKTGSLHVEPPFEVIRRMITLRVHLDDVDETNAPLLIVPGSHDLGRIAASEIDGIVAKFGAFPCLAEAGDAWAYSTGILHASNRAQPPRHRRVLQVDFTAMALPGGLEWSGIGLA